MKTLRFLALFLALAVSAPAQQLISNPTFQGSAQSDLNMGGHAIAGSTISKDQVGLSNVENTALSTWGGSANITTLGTITAGTWHGTPIDSNHIAWPTSLQLPTYLLYDSSGQTSVGWSNRGLYSLHLGNDGNQYNEQVLSWGYNNSWLYAWDYQPLDSNGDDGTNDNGGVLYPSQQDPFLNIQTGDIYGWAFVPWEGARTTYINGNLLNSILYSNQYVDWDAFDRFKSVDWQNRLLFDGTSQMGDDQWDDPIPTQSISVDWGARYLYSGVTFTTTVEYPWDPGDPQSYTGTTNAAVASWQGGLHPTVQNVGGGVPYGMQMGMTYTTAANINMNFVLPMNAAPGAIFTIVDTKGGGFRVSQQSVGTLPGYPNDVTVRMGSNVTTAGSAGYVTCGPYSVISIMAVDGYFYGSPYNVDWSGGYGATRTWIVVSYSLGTPTFN